MDTIERTDQIARHERVEPDRRPRFSQAQLASVVVLLLLAVLSVTALARTFSTPQTYAHQIEVLDQKKGTVMGLSVSSAIASTTISLAPGDAGSAISDQLAGFSKDFTIILGAILLEKYLLTTLGFVVFGIIIPICCAMGALSALLPRHNQWKGILFAFSVHLVLIGVVVWGSIPATVMLTDKIQETYDESINAAIESVNQTTVEAPAAENPTGSGENVPHDLVGQLSGAVNGAVSAVGDAASAVGNVTTWAQDKLSAFVESLAVMAVTTLVIPVLVPLAALYIVKLALTSALGARAAAPVAQPHELPGKRA